MYKIIVALLLSSSAYGEAPFPKWTGPIAMNPLGELVEDTPEVAQAKSSHFQAHAEILSVLPELPPEIRYQTGPGQAPIQPSISQPIHRQNNFDNFQPQRNFNSGIPNNAKNTLLDVYRQIKQILPELNAAERGFTQTRANFIPQQTTVPANSIADTPEVAAAKAEHARAVAGVRAIQAGFGDPFQGILNQPVAGGPQLFDTPEVQAAKLEHARAVAAARAAQAGFHF